MRSMIIPAAGRGSRLGADLPKVLVPVDGRAMIDHLIALYRGVVDHWVLVVAPADRALVEAHLAEAPVEIEFLEQAAPTGMLDAILIPGVAGSRLGERVWITWCDQIGVDPRTVARLIDAEARHPDLVLPTVRTRDPYIHFVREDGRIVEVLHRREGDELPDEGESDMGLFSLSRHAYESALPDYARSAPLGRETEERNFLPFIPWLAATGRVMTVDSHDPIEALGVNTPEDLHRMEAHLAGAGAPGLDGS